jgi:mannosyltransferase OCH1-like enzyme
MVLFYYEINITYGFIALVFVVFYYKLAQHSFVGNGLIKPRTKETENTTDVPFILYQTWHSKKLPPKMAECVDKLTKQNPEFEHRLFDDADCRAFIKGNYDSDVLEAYDRLVPGAYKADLWRYCVLYKTGGVYLDIKFQCEPGFSLMEFTKDSETFVLDRPYGDLSMPVEVNLAILNAPDFYDQLPKYTEGAWKNRQVGLYNAVMATAPGNPVLQECIQQIVENVRNEDYGFGCLYPTGPGLLGEKYFGKSYETRVKKVRFFNSMAGNYILSKDRKVLSHYPQYRQEQTLYSGKGPVFYYSDLWYHRKVYGSVAPLGKKIIKKPISGGDGISANHGIHSQS